MFPSLPDSLLLSAEAEALPPDMTVCLFKMLHRLNHVGAEGLTEVAESTLPAVRTEALEGVHSIDAGPSVSTGVADAVVDI